MDTMPPPAQGQGAWVFVSHSNRDIAQVREVRNLLEGHGHNPVLFFLKCMANTEADDRLLWALIEREIRAREWFILCDSPNARASAAVLREMALVQSLAAAGRVVERIDLERDLQEEMGKVVRLARRATVHLAYAHTDAPVAGRLGDLLREHGFGVWTDEQIPAGQAFASAIRASLEEAAARGFVLVLLSPESCRRRWLEEEVAYALQQAAKAGRGSVIPVYLEGAGPALLPSALRETMGFDLASGAFEARVAELARLLKTIQMR